MQVEHFERCKEVGICSGNRSILRCAYLREWFEERPVFNISSMLRRVTNPIESRRMLVHNPGYALRDSTVRAKYDRGVKVLYSVLQTFSRHHRPKLGRPRRAANVGKSALSISRSHDALQKPRIRHASGIRIIIFPLNVFKLCEEFEIDTKPSECFQETAETLRGRIENAKCTGWVVEAIVEPSFDAVGPIRRLPRIRLPAYSINRPEWFGRSYTSLPADKEGSSSRQNLLTSQPKIRIVKKSDRRAVVKLRVEANEPGLNYLRILSGGEHFGNLKRKSNSIFGVFICFPAGDPPVNRANIFSAADVRG